MFTAQQAQIFNAVTRGLELPTDSANPIRIVQTPGYIDSVIETHDLAVALLGAVGQSVAAVGECRGLGSQRVTIDRRHAGLVFNEIAYFFQSGWQFDISAVHTPVNGFYQTATSGRLSSMVPTPTCAKAFCNFWTARTTARRLPNVSRRMTPSHWKTSFPAVACVLRSCAARTNGTHPQGRASPTFCRSSSNASRRASRSP